MNDMSKKTNAIIMAAGMSRRLAPLSSQIPKGLLRVRSEILIEREIEQLQAAGIWDITVVVGYMHEKFMYLEQKYHVDIVFNKDFARYNNPSTLMCVLDKLSDTYICSSDNYFTTNVFETSNEKAFYSAVYSKGKTEEYCLSYDDSGLITDVTIGGSDSWYMLGHVYFTKEFSERFKKILITEYSNPETRNHLWEDLYIRYISDMHLYIKKYADDIIYEFDTLEELQQFDPCYNNTSFIEKIIKFKGEN